MTNKEKFLALVSGSEPETMAEVKERNRNRAMIEESQDIALKVLARLDELNWTQKKLAEMMQVSPQQVNKIVKGQENLTLATQRQLQDILNIPILASYYEKAVEQILTKIVDSFKQNYKKPQPKIIQFSNYQQSVHVSSSVMKAEEPLAAYETYTLQA